LSPGLLAGAVLAATLGWASAATLSPVVTGDAAVSAALSGLPNKALASGGASAFSSSDIGANYDAGDVNDGLSDNSGFSWIPSTTASNEFVAVQFPSPITLASVVWLGEQGYNGRSGGTYSLQYTTDSSPSTNSTWTEIGTYTYSETGCASPMPRSLFVFPVVPNVTGMRLVMEQSTCGEQLAVQEFEAYGPFTSPPSITTQPAGGTVMAGDDFSFSLLASGAYSFQWYKNGLSISGATSYSYSISGVTTNDTGTYLVVAGNGLGSVTSAPVVLTVTSAPVYATYSAAVLAASPIHYYPLNETNGTTAADLGSLATSGGVYDGGITLGQPSGAGLLGLAPHFDGKPGTFVDLGLFHPGDSVTVEAWVNLDSDAPVGTFNSFVARWDGSYELDFAAGEVANLWVRNDSNATGDAAAASSAARGQWHYIVGEFSGGVASIWVDGVKGSQGNTGGVLQNAGPTPDRVLIGATRDGTINSFNFKGFIADVAFYDHALSSGQIRSHYNTVTLSSAPTLGIQRAVMLSWPTFPPGYVLQAASNAAGPYVTVTNTPTVEGGQFTVALPINQAESFFRIVRP
jgi:hypothetical protein